MRSCLGRPWASELMGQDLGLDPVFLLGLRMSRADAFDHRPPFRAVHGRGRHSTPKLAHPCTKGRLGSNLARATHIEQHHRERKPKARRNQRTDSLTAWSMGVFTLGVICTLRHDRCPVDHRCLCMCASEGRAPPFWHGLVVASVDMAYKSLMKRKAMKNTLKWRR